MPSRRLVGIPSLKRFLLRSEVLQLYREMLRTIHGIPDEVQRKELKLWVRKDFDNNKHHTDEDKKPVQLCKLRDGRSLLGCTKGEPGSIVLHSLEFLKELIWNASKKQVPIVKEVIKMLIIKGRRSLRELQQMLNLLS